MNILARLRDIAVTCAAFSLVFAVWYGAFRSCHTGDAMAGSLATIASNTHQPILFKLDDPAAQTALATALQQDKPKKGRK